MHLHAAMEMADLGLLRATSTHIGMLLGHLTIHLLKAVLGSIAIMRERSLCVFVTTAGWWAQIRLETTLALPRH